MHWLAHNLYLVQQCLMHRSHWPFNRHTRVRAFTPARLKVHQPSQLWLTTNRRGILWTHVCLSSTVWSHSCRNVPSLWLRLIRLNVCIVYRQKALRQAVILCFNSMSGCEKSIWSLSEKMKGSSKYFPMKVPYLTSVPSLALEDVSFVRS